MNILVCVKQVPDTTEIKIDPVTNTLIRAGVPSILNTFDSYALEQALLLREKLGGTITVVSMGPPQAKEVLRECLSKGADHAYLVSDRVFGGSDTLATSYILSKAIEYLEKQHQTFDLILCGKQAIDGDTGQVGPEIAEHLNRTQVTFVASILSATDGVVIAQRENEGHLEHIQAQTPSVLTVVKSKAAPRYASIAGIMDTWNTEIPVLTSAELNPNLQSVGLKGSPTKVKKTFTPKFEKQGILISEGSNRESAVTLVSMLTQRSLI